MIKKPWSLQTRLTALLTALVLVLWGLSAVVIYWRAQQESQELFDNAIAETSQLLLFLSEHELTEVGPSQLAAQDHPESNLVHPYLSFQLWDKAGVLRYRSANAPTTPLAPLAQQGFGWQGSGDTQQRTYNLLDAAGEFRIVVSEPLSHRQEISADFFRSLLMFSLVLLPLAFWGVRWVVRSTLESIQRCKSALDNWSAKSLQPLAVSGLPLEIEPLVSSLNKAVARIDEGLQKEKRFTADAAHELRTPLSGIRANVQVLHRLLQRPDELIQDTLSDTLLGVDRCSRLIEQLLLLARSEGEDWANTPAAPVQLGPLIATAMQQEAPHAQSKGVQVRAHEHVHALCERLRQEAVLPGHETALGVLLRNLINNAIAYNQAGGQVEVGIELLPHGPHSLIEQVNVWVRDNGPGIDPALRPRVLERFYRLHPNTSTGSGLGLSICTQVAHLHNTQLMWGEGLNGKGVGIGVALKTYCVPPAKPQPTQTQPPATE